MIKSFRHKGLKRFYQVGDYSKVSPTHARRLRLILTLLEDSAKASDMNFPGSGLHELKGEMEGYWAVRVSGNWRLVFRLESGDAFDVDYLDYH